MQKVTERRREEMSNDHVVSRVCKKWEDNLVDNYPSYLLWP